MIEQYRFAAVILVYRNADDLAECIQSFQEKIPDCRIVVVNAFYDEDSRQRIEDIARENDCDFLNIENRGYSYGNNRGIGFVLRHIPADYIIVSNPDIIIRKFSMQRLGGCEVIAPKVTTLTGKQQNPGRVFDFAFTDRLIYKGLLRRRKLPLYIGLGINKVVRELFLRLVVPFMGAKLCVYNAHGSFIVIKREVAERVTPLFDENMFLFGEEDVFAWKMKKNHFPICFTKDIQILHKEDGSMKLSSLPLQEEGRKSAIYFYTHYRENNGQTNCSDRA